MWMSSRLLGAAFMSVAAGAIATPAFAQQETPAAGQAVPEASGTGAKAPGMPAPEGVPPSAPPVAAPPQSTSTPELRSARSAIVAAKVNLRSGPGTDTAVVTTISAGTTVQIANCTGEWCMVIWNGRSGFAIARNLNLGGTGQAKGHRVPPGYAGWRPPSYGGPPIAYGAPAYHQPPAVVYAPGYYYYGRRYYYGWPRGW